MDRKAKKIAVTGAAGQICYSLLFRIAKGEIYGPEQPIILQLLDVPQAQSALNAVALELEDSAFPLLNDIIVEEDAAKAFVDVDAAFLVGARPRSKGMERRDLLSANADIFRKQGRALDENAKREARVVVVGNPANTNAMILARSAPSFPSENITAMTRLDHNRALWQLSRRAGVEMRAIRRLAVWGNHSPTMFPDWTYATVDGESLPQLVGDDRWYWETLIPNIAGRGAVILQARGASSAASAANAAIDHMQDWIHGSGDDWTSMAVLSDGSYDIPEGLMCSVPVICRDGSYARVGDLAFDPLQKRMIDRTVAELIQERDSLSVPA